ncbi:MAG: hypothetical protein FWH46_05865 [Methanimicrococcus sp.]|nr:hypothetical protein [Methanimicrococcus sp.]
MYPTTLVPLLPYIESGVCINENVKGYISSISNSITVNPPFVLEKIERGRDYSKMQFLIKSLSPYHDISTLNFFFSELVDNIKQHSDFKNAFVMAQVYKKHKFIEFCLYDDGISIPTSLRLCNESFKSIEDCHLINYALNGVSSKTKEDYRRGFGMNSSARIIFDGYRGELFIASSDGSIHFKSGERDPIIYSHKTDEEYYRTKGTLIGLRIPYEGEKVFYHQYIDGGRSFKGKEAEL